MTIMTNIKQNYQNIRHRIAEACELAGRDPNDVLIVAVSKTVGPEEIKQAIDVGINDFAESRTTLFKERQMAFPQQNWHFIGMIQTNKVKDFAGRAVLVHSVASERALRAIEMRMELLEERELHGAQTASGVQQMSRAQGFPGVQETQAAPLTVQPVLVEVNVSGEASKDGVTPTELDALLSVAMTLPHIRVEGLMTMAPLSDEASIRATFRGLAELRGESASRYAEVTNNKLSTLSMGMSQDYVIAVEEGATIVRIGRALWYQ